MGLEPGEKLLNSETQNIKVVSYAILNLQPRLTKNQSSESAFWSGLVDMAWPGSHFVL